MLLAHRGAESINGNYEYLLDEAEEKRIAYEEALEDVKRVASREMHMSNQQITAALEGRKGQPRKTLKGSLAEDLAKLIP